MNGWVKCKPMILSFRDIGTIPDDEPLYIRASTIQAVFKNNIENCYTNATGIISNGMQFWVEDSVEYVLEQTNLALGK